MTSSKGVKAALHVETPESSTVSQLFGFKQTNVKKRRHDGDTLNPEGRKEQKEEAEDEEKARDLNFKARRRKYVTFPQKH